VVISEAQELDAILISLNGDFADIVTYPPEKYKGIIFEVLQYFSDSMFGFLRMAIEVFYGVTMDNDFTHQMASKSILCIKHLIIVAIEKELWYC
jgi:hypothetical protein